jgi:hypothetical protein
MDREQRKTAEVNRQRTAHIAVRGEFGPRLAATLPECEITSAAGETHITVRVRDDAELFGVLERLRDLGAELVSLSMST